MDSLYHRFYNAITYTLEYYEIGRIRNHMLLFAGKTSDLSYSKETLSDWYDLMFDLHSQLENEIREVIATHTPTAQYLFFDTVRKWLNEDYRLIGVNREKVLQEIWDYNEKTEKEFELRVTNNVDAHRNSPHFNRAEKEEYEVEVTTPVWALFLPNANIIPYTQKKIHHKIHCIEEIPPILDWTYFKDYIQLLTKLIDSLRGVLLKYSTQYEQGKIPYSNTATIGNTDNTKLLAPPQESKKVKFKLSVAQLSFLFRMLFDAGLIDTKVKEDLYRFISENSESKRSNNISTNAIGNDFNSIDKATATFWEAKLKEMLKQAKSI